MVQKIKLLIGILVISIILIGGWFFWKDYQISKEVIIVTDKTEYEKGDDLRITISNDLAKNICFSVCYPYFLEKKNNEWKGYSYGKCQKEDLNEKCIEPGDSKGFEFTLSLAEPGLHRIAVAVCENCRPGEEFKESQRFYSNEFIIK